MKNLGDAIWDRLSIVLTTNIASLFDRLRWCFTFRLYDIRIVIYLLNTKIYNWYYVIIISHIVIELIGSKRV